MGLASAGTAELILAKMMTAHERSATNESLSRRTAPAHFLPSKRGRAQTARPRPGAEQEAL